MPITLSARVDFADGTHLEGRRSYWRDVGQDTWPVLLHAGYDDLLRLRGRSGRYTGTIRYTLHRVDRVATLPIRVGAEYFEHSSGIRIVDVAPQDDACHVTLKKVDVHLAALGAATPVFNWQFVDRHGRATFEHPARVNAVPEPLLRGLSPSNISRTVRVDYLGIAPMFRPVPRGGPGGGARCEDLTLAIDRTQLAGEITRTLELPDFAIDEATSGLVTGH
jgi:hypothetical protein